MNRFRRLLRSAWLAARWWWKVDRVRISPREGRLLRLEPPCLLRLGGLWAQVVGREVATGGAGPSVVYRLNADAGSAVLRVARRPGCRALSVHLRAGAGEESLPEEEIEVFPRGPGQGYHRIR